MLYGHPLNTDTVLQSNTALDTHSLWTPHYYRQFTLSLGRKEASYIFFKYNPLNTDTPLIWTLPMARSVSVLTAFDCNKILEV